MHKPGAKKQDIEEYAKEHTSEHIEHIDRVFKLAKKLVKNYDEEVLHAACYLHHLEKDHNKAAERAEEFLKHKGFPPERIFRIKDAILHHPHIGRPKSIEAIALHDADLLDYLGAVGFVKIALEVKKEFGHNELKSIVSVMKDVRNNAAKKLVLKQSMDKAADKIVFMDFAIHELEKELD